MVVRVNGKERDLDAAQMSVRGLLDLLGVRGPMIAVELNREIVKKDRYVETLVRDGDSIEILQLVGGG
jgi:sulfur carrier protein